MIYYAHSHSDVSIDRWQVLLEHLLAVGHGARVRAEREAFQI